MAPHPATQEELWNYQRASARWLTITILTGVPEGQDARDNLQTHVDFRALKMEDHGALRNGVEGDFHGEAEWAWRDIQARGVLAGKRAINPLMSVVRAGVNLCNHNGAPPCLSPLDGRRGSLHHGLSSLAEGMSAGMNPH
ncbi:hypothetical protein KM043_002185 [Ampulex compressa]|nr:hypothetical protein KM043_002185 [Ampulex compressa]